MAPPSKSEVDQYYKWTAINLVGILVAFAIYYTFLSKKYGITGFVVVFIIIFAGIKYFQYKDGYVPLYRRSLWTQ